MKEITTGDGLNIFIACDHVPHHNWMSFACWYSLNKMLPDAQIALGCTKNNMMINLFSWARTLKIKIHYHQEKDLTNFMPSPLLIVDADMMMINEPDCDFGNNLTVEMGSNMCCDVKEEKNLPFVSYREGWGNFVTSSWINKISTPFHHRFTRVGMTPNEMKVDKLWRQMSVLFQTVSRG